MQNNKITISSLSLFSPLSSLLLAALALGACTARGVAPVGPDITPAEKIPEATDKPSAPNAQMQEVLDKLASLGGAPIETLDADAARMQPTPADAVKALVAESGQVSADEPMLAQIQEREVTGGAGSVMARFYYPQGAAVKPVIMYYHGGGFVIGNRDVYDAGARALAKKTGAIVVSVDYRRAPEAKFPAAHDDAFAAYKWALKKAGSFGGDPKNIAVAGESAGANLAINVSMRARDEGLQMPVHQLLVYPVAGTDMTTATYQIYSAAKPLNPPMMKWFFNNYLNGASDASDPRINVVAANLRALPATTLVAAEIDPLNSEGRVLADNLKHAGVEVSYQNYKGVTHEFFGMAAWVDAAKEAQAFAANRLIKAFGSTKGVGL